MKKRSGFNIMLRLIGLVRPLAPYMVLAIAMGLIGHLCATFITVFGGFAVTGLLGLGAPLSLTGIFIAAACSRSCAGCCATPSRPATTS